MVLINTLNVGGAETFIMKVFRAIDREKIVFDFLINSKEEGAYEKEVEALGGRVYHGYFMVEHPIKNLAKVYQTVKHGGYKKVFVFTQHPITFLNLLMSTLAGAKTRVVRSTNSACGGRMSNFLARVFRPLMNTLVTVAIAPSKEAGVWLFGRRMVRCGKVSILNNGVDLAEYNYSEGKRRKAREDLGYSSDEFVVGHVGRFSRQKNHLFLLDVFAEIYRNNKQARLLLVGKGETMETVESRIEDLELKDVVEFAGIRSDVDSVMNAMDIMVFPSFYEGMPNVIIEAQACGLPCLIADTISPDVAITEFVQFESLSASATEWAREITLFAKEQPRYDTGNEIKEKGYSIASTVGFLERVFK